MPAIALRDRPPQTDAGPNSEAAAATDRGDAKITKTTGAKARAANRVTETSERKNQPKASHGPDRFKQCNPRSRSLTHS